MAFHFDKHFNHENNGVEELVCEHVPAFSGQPDAHGVIHGKIVGDIWLQKDGAYAGMWVGHLQTPALYSWMHADLNERSCRHASMALTGTSGCTPFKK